MNSRTRQAIDADIRALCGQCDHEHRGTTPAERGRLNALKAELDGTPYGVTATLARPTRAEREREFATAVPAPSRRAPATPVVSLADHRRAVQQNVALARCIAAEEAGHLVVGLAEGLAPATAGFNYLRNCLMGALEVSGGYARFVGNPAVPAATAIAGLEAARMFGLEAALPGDGHARDEQLERAAIGYDWTARKQATRYARAILNRHAAVVGAIADRIVATGVVEGAELSRLLAPVRQRAA